MNMDEKREIFLKKCTDTGNPDRAISNLNRVFLLKVKPSMRFSPLTNGYSDVYSVLTLNWKHIKTSKDMRGKPQFLIQHQGFAL